MSELERFYSLVLPSQGKYCLARGIDGKLSHKYYDTLTELLRDLDLMIQNHVAKVYHGCGSYGFDENGKLRRTAACTTLKRCFHVDCDVASGDAKPYEYALKAEILLAVERLTTEFGIPRPLIVDSGRGYHLYWPFAEDMPGALWTPRAKKLKQILKRIGFKASPERTADVASILRALGSLNEKTGTVVDVVQWAEPSPWSEWLELDADLPETPAAPVADEASETDEDAAQMGKAAVYSADTIADHCACLGAFRDQHGVISEPLWHHGINLLTWCQGGEAVAHRWSSGDPRYTHAETAAKFAKAHHKPITCAEMAALDDGKLCKGCAFKGDVTTPLLLQSRLNGLPDGYVLDGDAIMLGEGKKAQTIFTSLVRVMECVTRESDATSRSYVFSLQARESFKKRVVVIPAGALVSKGGLTPLFQAGGVASSVDASALYIRKCASMAERWTDNPRTLFEYQGHKGDYLLVGDTLYMPGQEPVRVIVADELASGPALYTKAGGQRGIGSLDGWRHCIDKLFGRKERILQMALLCNGLNIFLPWMNSEQGGLILHGYSYESGTGKSTLLFAIVSLFGDRCAHEVAGQDNVRNIMAKLAVNCHLPTIRNELRPGFFELKDYVEMFDRGRDVSRLTKDGVQARAPKPWCGFHNTTGNSPLVPVIIHGGGSTALATRLCDFRLPVLDKVYSEKEGINALAANPGHAAAYFYRWLYKEDKIGWMHELMNEAETHLRLSGWSSEFRYYRSFLTTSWATLRAISASGLLKIDPEALIRCLQEHVELNMKNFVRVTNPYKELLPEFQSAHLQEFIVVQGTAKGNEQDTLLNGRVPRRAVGRSELATSILSVQKSVFFRWVSQQGFKPEDVLDYFAREGVLLAREAEVNLTRGTPLPGMTVTCVRFNLAKQE